MTDQPEVPEPPQAQRVAPPPAVKSIGPGAFTPRALPWQPGPARIDYARTTGPDGTEWIMVGHHTGNSTNVSYWLPEALEKALRNGLNFLGALPDGLILAGPDDLRGLDVPGAGG